MYLSFIYHNVNLAAMPDTITVRFTAAPGKVITSEQTGTATYSPSQLYSWGLDITGFSDIISVSVDGYPITYGLNSERTTSEDLYINVYLYDPDTFAGKVLANSTVNSGEPDFSTVATTDEGMFMAEDNDGTSAYFRGAVTNNYVYFAEKYWRIIRINGDGSVRMIYDGTEAHENGTATRDKDIGHEANNGFGYMFQSGVQHGNTTSSNIKVIVDDWYAENLLQNYSHCIADSGFWGDRAVGTDTVWTDTPSDVLYYAAYERLYQNHSPSLVCDEILDFFTVSNAKGNQALTYPIGLITADECIFAGGYYRYNSSANSQFYLARGSHEADLYMMTTMTSGAIYNDYDEIVHGTYQLDYSGTVLPDRDHFYYTRCIRPVINLYGNLEATGSGTSTDPYSIVVPSLTPVNIIFHEIGDVTCPTTATVTFEGHDGSTLTETVTVDTSTGTATLEAAVPTPLRRVSIGDSWVAAVRETEIDGELTVTVDAFPADSLAGTIIATNDPIPYSNTSEGSAYQPDFSTVATTDEGMFTAPDNDGASAYFRGATENNYVYFAGYYWRIIRTNGDGSIRLIYQGRSTSAELLGISAFNDVEIGSQWGHYIGYTYEEGYQRPTSAANATDSTIKTALETWYNGADGISDYDSYITSEPGFWNDRETAAGYTWEAVPSDYLIYYAVRARVYTNHTPSLVCTNEDDLYKTKVGLITADEVAMAGVLHGTSNTSSYLFEGSAFWTMSPCTSYSTGGIAVMGGSAGLLQNFYMNSAGAVRPVINLVADVSFTGTGSSTDPYTIDTGTPTNVVMMFREPDGSLASVSETTATFESHSGETYTETISVTGGGWGGEIVNLPTPLRRVIIGDGTEWVTVVSESDGYVEVTAYRTNTLTGTIIAKGDPVPWTDTEAGSAYQPDFSTTATTDEGMFTALDLNGWSPYFRGATTNNYVKFGDWYWRIIRVNGDGTIRIIYDGTQAYANETTSTDRQIGTCAFNSVYMGGEYVGYTYETGLQRPSGEGADSNVKAYVDEWYDTNIANNGKLGEYVATGIFINDRQFFTDTSGTTEGWSSSSGTYYSAPYVRLVNCTPSLGCEYYEDEYYLSAGLISADEVALAGGVWNTANANESYYLHTGTNSWTMSPGALSSGRGSVVYTYTTGALANSTYVSYVYGVRPVINLNYNITEFTGSGTMIDPYEVIVPGVLVVNNVEPTQVFCDGVEVSEVYYNGKLVFRKEE